MTFKMPEPISIYDHPEHNWVWKDSEAKFIDARVNNALRDVLEQARAVDWFEIMREGHLVTRRDAETLSNRIEDKLRAMIKEIPE
jgi:flavin-binding protein dodecin